MWGGEHLEKHSALPHVAAFLFPVKQNHTALAAAAAAAAKMFESANEKCHKTL